MLFMSSQKTITISIGKTLFLGTIALLPLAIIGAFLLLRFASLEFYTQLNWEDEPVEYATSLFYLLASIVSVLIARTFFRRQEKLLFGLYLFFSLGLFFIFGEEISWGQRIFGIVLPQFFAENNVQGETTIHNLEPIQVILHQIYIVIGLVGAFGWLVAPKRLKQWRGILPAWYLSLYFLQIAVFYIYIEYMLPQNNFLGVISRDQEPPELILGIGFLLYTLSIRYWQSNQYGLKKSSIFTIAEQ